MILPWFLHTLSQDSRAKHVQVEGCGESAQRWMQVSWELFLWDPAAVVFLTLPPVCSHDGRSALDSSVRMSFSSSSSSQSGHSVSVRCHADALVPAGYCMLDRSAQASPHNQVCIWLHLRFLCSASLLRVYLIRTDRLQAFIITRRSSCRVWEWRLPSAH